MNEKLILSVRRLPARLDVQQAADVLGFLPHEISILLKTGMLKPLGKPAANGHKFFCALEISALCENRDWLDKATRTVAKHWQERNRCMAEKE